MTNDNIDPTPGVYAYLGCLYGQSHSWRDVWERISAYWQLAKQTRWRELLWREYDRLATMAPRNPPKRKGRGR